MAVTLSCLLILGLNATFRLVYSGALFTNNGIPAVWLIDSSDTAARPRRVYIDYYRAYTYKVDEWDKIEEAMQEISSATQNCIVFRSRNRLPPDQDWLFIRPEGVGAAQPTQRCRSPFNGYSPSGGKAGQSVILFGSQSRPGVTGCLDNKPRETLRVLLNAIGLGNEYQRFDRNQSIVLSNDLLGRISDRYVAEFDENPSMQLVTDFDYSSATMISGREFARHPKKPLFTLPDFALRLQVNARLSNDDCRTLNYAYDCRIDCGNSVGVQPTIIKRSMHCWTTTDRLTTSEKDDEGRGDLGEYTFYGVPLVSSYTATLTSASGDVELTSNSFVDGKLRFRLRNKIKEQLDTTVIIEVRDPTGRVLFTRNVKIEISCYPRLVFLGEMVPCRVRRGDGDTDASGYTVPNCEHSRSGYLDVECDEDNRRIVGNFGLGKVQVLDPDCVNCNKRIDFSAQVGREGSAFRFWVLTPSGQLIWAAPQLDPATEDQVVTPDDIVFDFLYLDHTKEAVVRTRITVYLQCVNAPWPDDRVARVPKH